MRLATKAHRRGNEGIDRLHNWNNYYEKLIGEY